MASNPISSCCASGFKHSGNPSGTIDQSWTTTSDGNVEAYISKPPAGTKDLRHGIIFVPDIIGHTSNNAQLLADSFAARGYTVVIPDLFFNDAVDLDAYQAGKVELRPTWFEGGYSPRKIPHVPKTIDPVIANTIIKMRNELELKKVGAVGYCFGAKEVNTWTLGYTAHPVVVEVEELAAVKRPLSIAASEIDQVFPAELRHKSEEILIKTGVPWQINLYGSVSHGFAVRGDLKDRRLKFAMEAAFEQAVIWFGEWLKD